jgi:carboxypeptidase C (cathepsin A)
MQGINPYNIYDDCHHLDPQNADIRFSNTSYNDLNIHSDIGYDEMEDDYDYYALKPKCISDGYITYMNSMDVRDAIHIPTDVKEWIKCKTGLPQFVYDRQHKNMKPEFLKLINKHKIKPFIVFNGDLDLVCDFMGCQLFIDKLKLSLTQKYQPWYYNGVVGGFVKRYDGLTFITVRAAGHMVSTDKPGLGLKIIRELLGIENI